MLQRHTRAARYAFGLSYVDGQRTKATHRTAEEEKVRKNDKKGKCPRKFPTLNTDAIIRYEHETAPKNRTRSHHQRDFRTTHQEHVTTVRKY